MICENSTIARLALSLFALIYIDFSHAQEAPPRADAPDRVGYEISLILNQPDATLDLARAKLTFDRMVDPSIDIEASLQDIEDMVLTIKEMAGPDAGDREKLSALRQRL